jgi:hypothetical protein
MPASMLIVCSMQGTWISLQEFDKPVVHFTVVIKLKSLTRSRS